jgi:type II secretory pathway pseudopilin PulG
MRKISDKKGITLIELLIGVFISTILIGSALNLYLTQHKHLIVQEQVSNMQHNIRAGLQEIVNSVRMAGYNLPIGVQPITISNTNPDTIMLVFDSRLLDNVTINHTMPVPSAELRCDGNISPLHDGDWAFIYDPLTQSGEFFLITEVQVGSGHIQHNTMPLSRCYEVGARILGLCRYKYYIDQTTDPLHPNLMAEKQHPPAQIYADNITDLQFQYVLSNGMVVDVPPFATMIREVIITMAARTDRPDNEMGDQYRTRALQTRVKVRNLSIN